ncbi:MAG: pilin [Patescibacteria group bacterium]
MKMGGKREKILKKFLFSGVLSVLIFFQAIPVLAACPFEGYSPGTVGSVIGTITESEQKDQDLAYLAECNNKITDRDFNNLCGVRCLQGCRDKFYTINPADYCGACYQLALASIGTKTTGATLEQILYSGVNIPELDGIEQFCKGNEKGAALVNAAKLSVCPRGPHGCCRSIHVKGDETGKGQIDKEQCPGQQPIYYGECFCEVGGTISPNQGVTDYNDCEKKCLEMGGKVDGQGIGKYKNLYAAASLSSTTQQQFVNALCFTREECVSEEYGGSSDAIVESGECMFGKVKCRAPEPDLTLSSPILGVTSIKGLRQYLELMFRFAMSIVALTAAVAFIWGGFKYIVGSSAGDITKAKNTMINAMVGLLLATGAVMILNTINPAATRLTSLEVWLVNRMLFSEDQFCQDYKAKHGGEPKFADPGDPVGSIPYEQAEGEGKFVLDAGETKCGQEYYAKGYAGKTCFGMECGSGQACAACRGKSGLKECEGSTRPFTCIKAAMVINVNYTNGVVPFKLYLLGVCGWIQSTPNRKFDSDFVKSQIPKTIEAQRFEAGNVVTFVVPPEQGKLQDMIDACEENGTGNKLIGVLVGIAYKDTKSTVDVGYDVLVMKKNECTPGIEKFSGYANGSAWMATAAEAAGGSYAGELGATVAGSVAGAVFTTVEDDMKTAVYCGYRMVPGALQASKWREGNFNPTTGVYWETTELDRAFLGTEPITCSTLLDDKNAPSDPGDFYMSKCKSGWCQPEDDPATCVTTIAPMFRD